MTINDIQIDKEFRNLCPALSDEELRQLEANILADGRFTDPIIMWDGLVLDGHNRKDVWDNLPDDTDIAPPEIVELDLPDRNAAMNWIINHQLGRRSISPQQRDYLIGKLYNEKKKSQGGDRKTPIKQGSKSKVQNEPLIEDTASEVAAQTGSSRSKVKRKSKRTEAIDRIDSLNSKAGADLRSGALKPPEKDIVAVGKLPVLEIGKAIVNWRKGLKWNDDGKPAEPKKATGGPQPEKLTKLTKDVQALKRKADKIWDGAPEDVIDAFGALEAVIDGYRKGAK